MRCQTVRLHFFAISNEALISTDYVSYLAQYHQVYKNKISGDKK